MSQVIKLQPCIYEHCVSKESVQENCLRKESSDSEEYTVRLEILSGVLAESICCLDKVICEGCFKGAVSFAFEIFLSSSLLLKRK